MAPTFRRRGLGEEGRAGQGRVLGSVASFLVPFLNLKLGLGFGFGFVAGNLGM